MLQLCLSGCIAGAVVARSAARWSADFSSHFVRAVRLVAMTCALLAMAALARAQSLRPTVFDPGAAGGSVYATALQPDGKILVSGEFTHLGGGTGTTARNGIGRLNTDGTVDMGFNARANGAVNALVVQPDGKILVGGAFTTLGDGTGTMTRTNIGRFNADGSVDTAFNPGANNWVRALAVQPDRKILVAGRFTTLGGATRNYIGRLNADGSLDSSFTPDAGGRDSAYDPPEALAIAVQTDGKILVGGVFTGLGGATRNYIGRLNANGSVDVAFDPGTDSFVYAIVVQPDGKILVGGRFGRLGGGGIGTTTRNNIGRLNADGSLDTSFNPGANSYVHTFAVQPDGKILVGGLFTTLGGGGTGSTTRHHIGRLNADGSLETGFNPGASIPGYPETAIVFAIAPQPNGKILVAGYFDTLGGGTGLASARKNIGQLNADGTLESDYNPGATYDVDSFATQPDGKIVVGGHFSALGGGTGTTARARIGRLNTDGTLDMGFNPGASGAVNALVVQPDGKILVGESTVRRLNADGSVDTSFTAFAEGGAVYALALQPDGKILVGGEFTYLVGTARWHIGRLNGDGTLDTSFNPGTNGGPCVFGCGFQTYTGIVSALALQPDGKILVGGNFSGMGGGTGTTTRYHLGRLNADGSVDTGFNPGASLMVPGGIDRAVVKTLVVQGDGKILVGGNFTTLGGGGRTDTTARQNIGRLNADGSIDTSFDPGANFDVETMEVQTDGKILVAGLFTALGGAGRNAIGRLHSNGSIDGSFNPGASKGAGAIVKSVALQPDGTILVGGRFETLAGGSRNNIGWLTNTAAAVQSLSVTSGGSGVAWSRSGTGPEVWRVTFESSTDAVTYTSLGNGTRVTGGWQLTGQSLPIDRYVYIRARGYHAPSGSIVEAIQYLYVSASAPTITTQPQSQVVSTGQAATLSVVATGSGVTYQWYVGTSGTTTSPISGAAASSYTTPALTSTTSYWVRVSNTVGAADSHTATITITVKLPTMSLGGTALVFSAVTSGAGFTWQTPAQTVRLSQSGSGTVTWTAASTVPWLVVSPAAGSGPATLTISTQFASGLTASQVGSINIALTGAGNSVGPVNVTLTTRSSTAAASPPFGSFDTPAGDATVVAGSIALTGWTLDNIGVKRVELWRDLQAGETTPPFASSPTDPRTGKVFIANATFVEGARPDVEALNSTTPLASRAGWGYLLLTWGLWNQGNGAYKLYAFAFDEENNVGTIGSKTVIISNNTATKPFGSIDTPGIGGDASGPDFGWGLTPKVGGAATCKIQASGVQYSIDSGPLQPVVYGDARTDIAGAFPGFSNTAAAGGHAIIDWAALTNGSHTIGWLITDDCNRADGVGSRFFTVTTGTALRAEPADFRLTAFAEASAVKKAEAARGDDGRKDDPVLVARGYGELPEIVGPGEDGSRDVEIREGERIELRLPRGFASAYQLGPADQHRALPTGSTWDAGNETFSWQPAPGFLGPFRFVFTNGSDRISVRVIVTP
jgi:uncharacterized delta-60 repeat protein